jgi:murein DD-endopeptidase MepM/ murein hydrolase activator NlpD
LSIFILLSCKEKTSEQKIETVQVANKKQITQQEKYKSLFENAPDYKSVQFDFPVGKPNAKGYYNAQEFQENDHLGDDWNSVKGGNSDLGDTIYAISNGFIIEANYKGGWGNVVRINHLFKNKLYQSVYAHCDTVLIKQDQFVKRGDKIATIGNCNGMYLAHLHLEIRDSIELDIGNGYSHITKGYINPTLFIKNN